MPCLSQFGDHGMSLVEVMVAAGVMTIAMLAFTQMITNQQKETHALSQKLTVLDFQGLMGKVLADGSVCKFDLTDTTIPANAGNAQNFTDTLPTPIPAISLQQIHSSTVGSPPPIFAAVGSSLNSALSIASITINIISKLAPKQYKAELQVAFSGGIRPIKPAFASIFLTTDGGASKPGKETILDCMPGTSGTGSFPSKIVVYSTPGPASWTVPSGITAAKVTVIGGGGSGGAGSCEGGGGGAGGVAITVLTGLSATPSIPYTVGAGGGAVTNAAGKTGGTSSFAAPSGTLTAFGGSGGAAGACSSIQFGGAGGTASGGQLNIPGQPGPTTSQFGGVGGNGGSGPYGSGGYFKPIVGASPGLGYGAGGSGSRSGGASGVGSPGAIIIEY